MIGTEAERATIGAILLNGDRLSALDGILSARDFSQPEHETLWVAIQDMRSRREHVDVLTVGAKLGELGLRMTTVADLHNMVSEMPHSGAVAHYGAIVHEDAVRRRIRETASVMLQKVDSVAPGELISAAVADLRDSSSGGRVLESKTLGDVLAVESRFDWVIPGLLESSDRLMVTGGEGAGKSTLVRQLAILSSAGLHPFTFQPINPVRVLVVDAENSEHQWRRAAEGLVRQARIMGSHDPRDMRLACVPRLDVTRDTDLAQVHRMIDDWSPQIVVIGPLYRLIPRAINSDDDAAPLLAALDTIRDRGIALIIEAHAGHALNQGGERDLRPRGSAALMGWPEYGLGLRSPKPGEEGFKVVRWRGDRDRRDWPELLVKGGDFPWSMG